MLHQRRLRAVASHQRDGGDRQLLVAAGLAVGGAAVVADDPQHVLAVALVVGEGAELAGHLGARRVGDAGHDRGQRAADGAAFLRIVGDAGGHQQAADIGVAEAERAVLVGKPRDLLRRELRHHHRDLEHDGPQPDGVLVAGDVERAVLVAVGQQVDRGQVAGRVVEEHVFRARVGGPDGAGGDAGVPVVHRGVEMQARIGRGPGGVADLLPQVAGLERLRHLAGEAAVEVPVAVGLDGAQEVVLERDGVVGVLAGDGEIGLRIPVGVVGLELDRGVALLRELDDALDVVLRDEALLGGADLALERGVDGRVEAVVGLATPGALAVDAGLHDRGEVFLHDTRAGDEGGDLLLLLHLPVDIFLDVGMVDVDDHHLGGAAGGAARLDGAGGAVADLEEAHQAGRLAAARKPLAFAAQVREVGAGARAVLEQARLAHPQVHDAALVDEVVGDGLDEAGVRLRVLVGGFRLRQLLREGVDVVVALAGAVDAVGPVQAGVEPLRRVGRDALGGEHVGELVHEGTCIVLRIEIAALPAPVRPGAGEAREDLAGVGLGAVALGFRQPGERGLVGDGAPQEGGDVVLLDTLQAGGHAGLAEIFLRQDVGRDLGELRRHVDVGQPEDDRAVRIPDLAHRLAELDLRIGAAAFPGELPFNAHFRPSVPKYSAFAWRSPRLPPAAGARSASSPSEARKGIPNSSRPPAVPSGSPTAQRLPPARCRQSGRHHVGESLRWRGCHRILRSWSTQTLNIVLTTCLRQTGRSRRNPGKQHRTATRLPAAKAGRSAGTHGDRETGPDEEPSGHTRQTGCMAHKSRLARKRQGSVFGSFVTPNILYARNVDCGDAEPLSTGKKRLWTVPAGRP